MKHSNGERKEHIIKAAVKLFDSQGFNGTTVREIAKEADVNIALLSYYFKNKAGLLEYLMVRYFEGLFDSLDEIMERLQQRHAFDVLNEIISFSLDYQREHYKVARLIQRQLSVESMLAREIMGTYLTKQKHYYQSLLEEGSGRGEFRPHDSDITVIHLLSMMTFPYFNPQIIREVYHLEPTSESFGEQLKESLSVMAKSALFPGKGTKNEEF